MHRYGGYEVSFAYYHMKFFSFSLRSNSENAFSRIISSPGLIGELIVQADIHRMSTFSNDIFSEADF